MEVFDLVYTYYTFAYRASVVKTGNLYLVSPEEPGHAEIFGEYVFTEQGGKFTYKQKHITHLEYLVAVSIALQKHAGYL